MIIHSFIIKVWLEETGADTQVPLTAWQGYITHVPSGERAYIRETGDMLAFISAHLETHLGSQPYLEEQN